MLRKASCLLAAAAISGLALAATPSSASPLASGLANGNTALPALTEGLVKKVHGWHCGKRKGWYHGHRVWHRHRQACYDNDNYDDDYDNYDYGYYPRYRRSYGYGYPAYGYDYGYPGYGYGYPGFGIGVPFISFGFGGFGGHHHHHNW